MMNLLACPEAGLVNRLKDVVSLVATQAAPAAQAYVNLWSACLSDGRSAGG